MKVCIACSAGGHLTEALRIANSIKYSKFLMTFRSPHLRKTIKFKYHTITDPRRNPLRLAITFFQTLYILLKERPDVIISTGAGVTLSACYLGKLFGCKLIYVECAAQVTEPSWTGRLVYPITDLFIVQWRTLLKFYPRSKYGGLL
jgi:UDP-N-acetylglucosamine:LPS N-acetylglucosamine transferase